jgi:hypothetical protein
MRMVKEYAETMQYEQATDTLTKKTKTTNDDWGGGCVY